MVKKLALLGSTGSIGRQTLDIVRTLPEHFRIVGLAAGRNLDLLSEQIAEFKPRFISYDTLGTEGENRINIPGCDFLSLEEMAGHDEVDTVIVATSGTAGLGATLAAVEAGKNVALANKESLVSAGEIIMSVAERSGSKILPVDSEHSAIFQCLNGENQPPARIILTASGGPFRDLPNEQMAGITVEKALEHPSWKMGKKVTIDSATLMNKGLEIIEARWLFNVSIEDITVLVHPRSIVHSMVEFIDGSVKAQLSLPDMRLPIQYALTYPDRLHNPSLPRVDWGTFSGLEFYPPDTVKFPCLQLAREAGQQGGTFPAVLCAADEAVVDLFLARRIGFSDIPYLIEQVLEQHSNVKSPDLDTILKTETWARGKIHELVNRNSA